MSLLIAPLEALIDDRLTDSERRVLLALFSWRGKDTNTVWPGLEAIAERALIKDTARVSKLTSSLAKKGWLTKKKRGFTGTNKYTLTVPDIPAKLEGDANQEPDTNKGEDANLGNSPNLAPDTKLAGDAISNLAPDTKSNLASDAKCNEQTTEHSKEQTNSSVANATAAGAAFAVDNSLNRLSEIYGSENSKEAIFKAGVPWLVSAGESDQGARSVLGKLIKDHGLDRTLDALITGLMAQPRGPKAYLIAVAEKIGSEVPLDWVPSHRAVATLMSLAVPSDLIERSRDVFVTWMRERGVRHPDPDKLFEHWCVRDWERAEASRTAYLQRLAESAGLEYQQAWREPA